MTKLVAGLLVAAGLIAPGLAAAKDANPEHLRLLRIVPQYNAEMRSDCRAGGPNNAGPFADGRYEQYIKCPAEPAAAAQQAPN